ncbi:MAG: hypothetical protein QXF04_03775 [Candidatus Aenigmatarchaeota archaeon]
MDCNRVMKVVVNGAKWLIDAYLDAQTQAFVAVGVLGPGGRADNYPSVVSQGEEVKLYVYVMNYMKQPTWLRVTARYIDNLTEALPPMASTHARYCYYTTSRPPSH